MNARMSARVCGGNAWKESDDETDHGSGGGESLCGDDGALGHLIDLRQRRASGTLDSSQAFLKLAEEMTR